MVSRKDKLNHALDSIILPGSAQTEEKKAVVPETKTVAEAIQELLIKYGK